MPKICVNDIKRHIEKSEQTDSKSKSMKQYYMQITHVKKLDCSYYITQHWIQVKKKFSEKEIHQKKFIFLSRYTPNDGHQNTVK